MSGADESESVQRWGEAAEGGGLLPPTFRSRLDLGQSPPGAAAERTGEAFTPRAFLLGTGCAAFIGAGVAYSTLYLQGSFMALGFGTVGAVFLLFLLSGLINPLLKLVWAPLGLRRGEQPKRSLHFQKVISKKSSGHWTNVWFQ